MAHSARQPVQVGEVYESNNYGPVVVISYENSKHVTIRFVRTGYEDTVAAQSLRDGHVTDHPAKARETAERRAAKRAAAEKLARARLRAAQSDRRRKALAKEKAAHRKAHTPSLFGVGYLGVGPHRAYLSQTQCSHAYSVWRAMLRRCYYVRDGVQVYPAYRDCTVAAEWHNFQQFAEWFESHWPAGAAPGEYQLDKDIRVPGSRVYSPRTCQFVTPQQNLAAKRR